MVFHCQESGKVIKESLCAVACSLVKTEETVVRFIWPSSKTDSYNWKNMWLFTCKWIYMWLQYLNNNLYFWFSVWKSASSWPLDWSICIYIYWGYTTFEAHHWNIIHIFLCPVISPTIKKVKKKNLEKCLFISIYRYRYEIKTASNHSIASARS